MSGARPAVLAVGMLCATALAGCVTTAEKSARVGAQGKALLARGSTVDVSHPNRDVRVRRTAVLGTKSAAVVAVELVNSGAHAQAAVPILVDVRDAHGGSLYSNATPGLQPSLQRAAVVRAGRPVWWVDDQVTATATPHRAVARVGAGRRVRRAPRILLRSVHFTSDAGGRFLTGIVVNRTRVLQRDAPISAVALRGGRVVAAGRALVPVLPARPGPKPTRFRLFLTGRPAGARIVLSVSPTTLPT